MQEKRACIYLGCLVHCNCLWFLARFHGTVYLQWHKFWLCHIWWFDFFGMVSSVGSRLTLSQSRSPIRVRQISFRLADLGMGRHPTIIGNNLCIGTRSVHHWCSWARITGSLLRHTVHDSLPRMSLELRRMKAVGKIEWCHRLPG